ncbi:MAG: hypothetical protein NW703_14260 [Nitrospiraceae bacterium]
MTPLSCRQLLWAWIAAIALLYGCASPTGTQPADSVEARLDAPVEQVRDAVLNVFASQGYTVESSQSRSENRSEFIRTGYREEIRAPWDWMLRVRFGVGRTQAEADLNGESDHSTKLMLTVIHESKGSLVGSWTPSEPPLQQSAEHYLRLIRYELKLL